MVLSSEQAHINKRIEHAMKLKMCRQPQRRVNETDVRPSPSPYTAPCLDAKHGLPRPLRARQDFPMGHHEEGVRLLRPCAKRRGNRAEFFTRRQPVGDGLLA